MIPDSWLVQQWPNRTWHAYELATRELRVLVVFSLWSFATFGA